MRRAALDKVHELAQRDRRVLFIGSDLGAGTLAPMRAEFPDRWFMEGIAEANMIGMAAGLAMDGFVPYLNTIAPFFTRRANEQITIDLCLHKLPVRLIASGGGVVYAPLGPTHLAVDDIATMRVLPNMAVVAVADAAEMRRLMDQSLEWPGPLYIRLAKGGDPIVSDPARGFTIGKAIIMRDPGTVLLVTTGVMLGRALAAADLLKGQGISCGILHMHTVKPLDSAALRDYAAGVNLVVTIEEHSLIGGLGGAVAETLMDAEIRPPCLLRLALPDAFADEYGSQDTMLEAFGLVPPQIAAAIRRRLG
ncbi:MAG: transketolase C-terminal domain-containing protein [Azospirillaceae bacterium]|nr:transketolase C-terminal domain-containing protein [Azospirillaceae bacterium]